MNSFIIVQALGAATLILSVVSMQFRRKETFLLLQMLGALLFIVQFILTGMYTAAAMFVVAAVRGVVYYYFKKKSLKPSLAVLLIFQSALVVSAYFTWQNAWSIIPVGTTMLKTWGTWQDDMTLVRATTLVTQLCMIAYNLTAAIYTGALTEALNAVSSTVAVWRYDIRRKQA